MRGVRLPREPWRRFWLAVLALALALCALDAALPPPLAKAREVSTVVTDSRGAVLRVFPVEDGKWRLKADLDRIDPKFIAALLAYEDQRFASHAGVDGWAAARAVGSMLANGRVVSGGSTLTMQTARLLEPRPRTPGAKAVESARALQLERRFTKREILELYLTLAPYGGNLEGVRAASWAYFGREPDRLTPDQIALLVALPQSPEARRPDLRPAAAVTARARVLERLAAEGVFAADLAAESAAYPAPGRDDFPALAWHAAEDAAARAQGAADVRTTLNLAMQREFETLGAADAARVAAGVQTALIAVHVPTREVRALVGSSTRALPGGWIDLTDRPRSPGSTLKPFIYGLAFDDGLAAGGTRIADLPQRFSSYRPDNFDRTFRGDVTVAEALQHSLNVPAVAALEAIGARRFVAALGFAGAHAAMPLDADEETGLAVALGGVGLSVREVAALYAALADKGEARPLRLVADEAAPDGPGVRVMSAESAREIVAILESAPTPEGRMPAKLTLDAPLIAFKTGTSYGFRDAWAAGIAGEHVVVVWQGRADAAPRPGATGRDAALPLLFEAFDAIDRVTPRRERSRLSPGAPEPTPQPLSRFGRDAPPQILFPPHGSEVWADATDRGFVLAAEGRGALAWYADGEPVSRNTAGDPVWTPPGPGFYALAVVDAEGRTSRATVRVLAADEP